MKLFLAGGFLGSGKTTAIQNACMILMKQGVKVAVITNDQGAELVDTEFIRSFGIPAMEIPNGCFCCNYNELTRSISALQENEQSDVIFAESVGSCTDLVATIAKPLARFTPEIEVVISVFADAALLFSLISGASSFLNDEVRYIYKKQLAEADILVVNKIDLLEKDGLGAVQQLITREYPDKTILFQNSLEESHVEQWMKTLDVFVLSSLRQSLEIDYDIYAKGEAMLAWLDEEVDIQAGDGSVYRHTLGLIDKIEKKVRAHQYPIGHLKFLIDDGETVQKISYTAFDNAENKNFKYPVKNKVKLLINARIQAEPSRINEIISGAIRETAAQTGSSITINSLSAFQPAYPRPTYRM